MFTRNPLLPSAATQHTDNFNVINDCSMIELTQFELASVNGGTATDDWMVVYSDGWWYVSW